MQAGDAGDFRLNAGEGAAVLTLSAGCYYLFRIKGFSYNLWLRHGGIAVPRFVI